MLTQILKTREESVQDETKMPLLKVRAECTGLKLYDPFKEKYYDVPLTRDFTIGRELNNDIVIPNDYLCVSRVHCRIEHGFHLYDGNCKGCSKNGTYVDGKRIKKIILKPDQELSLGGSDLTNSYFFIVCRKEESD
jgi:hypothetical protein